MSQTPPYRWLLIAFVLAVLIAAVLSTAAPRPAGLSIALEERGLVIAPASAAVAPDLAEERAIAESVAEVRDFARRHPLPR